MSAEHGFLQPNPALFDLERRKQKPKLAHELGEGAQCSKCGDSCPGFQLHYWRKVCINCRCGKAEHNVVEQQDPGFYFVGKIFDRPLRSYEEELEFCYGTEEGENASPLKGSRRPRTVKFDWVPPNISKTLAKKYLETLPEKSLPIAGSEGAQLRKQQLERQFPKHDIEPKECHELSPGEIENMETYVTNVKENVVGQGQVMEMPSQFFGSEESDFPPPPAPELLDALSNQLERGAQIGSGSATSGTFFAKPVGGFPPSGGPKPFGSTSSSVGSSRNGTPSPTSSNDEGHPSNLARPSAFGKKSVPHGRNPSLPTPRFSSAGHGPLNHLTPGASASKARGTDGSKGQCCQDCRKELLPGDVAILAERAGPEKFWHPNCFKCHICKDTLVDLLYYYEEGQVYCARDYATKAKVPRCHACDELIFAAEYTGAEDQVFHLKHFCCYDCDRPLAGHKYIPINNQPHCLLCYQTKHGKVCHTCQEYIQPQERRLTLGHNHWHAKDECFCCSICQTSLVGQKMIKNYGMILCSSQCSREAKHRLEQDSEPSVSKPMNLTSRSTLV